MAEFAKIDSIQMRLLEEVADLHETPMGAYNIRANGQVAGRVSLSDIEIVSKKDVSGIDVYIKPDTKNKSVHIPVVLSQSGVEEAVYNDFHIGDHADVLIVAGCGIHNGGSQDSRHDGIHRFFVGKNAKVRYVEKHYGSGDGQGKRVMNPGTEIFLDENSYMELEMVQIKGIDSTKRTTTAELAKDAKLIIKERLLTHGTQYAESSFVVNLNGEGSSANVISRSVAKEQSHQVFLAEVNGYEKCAGHSECDSIIMNDAVISAIPKITAHHVDAALIHEAAIGKIAGEQIIKLMTLGLAESEAEEQIVNGFLK